MPDYSKMSKEQKEAVIKLWEESEERNYPEHHELCDCNFHRRFRLLKERFEIEK